MSPELFHDRVLALTGATYNVKFGDKRTYCIGGRMFARAGAVTDLRPLYGFKASELSFEILTGRGIAQPMPYLHPANWVQLLDSDALTDDELMGYVADGYKLIADRLTRWARRHLGIDAPSPSGPRRGRRDDVDVAFQGREHT